MTGQTEKPLKIGNEITVRISLTFQEAPDVHTLLAMTPVRERGKLVRLALERYIAETDHPAGDVEQQIHAISTWLRSRTVHTETAVPVAHRPQADRTICTDVPHPAHDTTTPMPVQSDPVSESATGSTSSIKRWLQV